MIELSNIEKTPESEARVLDLLMEHAERHGTPFETEHWQIDAIEDGVFLGGLVAKAAKDMVFVSYLAVSPEAQGRGLGKQLLHALEERARAAGKTGVWLDTFAFQAPEFYKALGYDQFGKLSKAHYGHDRFFFVKTF